MSTVYCKHKVLSKDAGSKECRRILADLPACVIQSLKDNPGQFLTFRCPRCPPYNRWIQVGYTGAGLTFKAVPEPSLGEEIRFDSIEHTEEMV